MADRRGLLASAIGVVLGAAFLWLALRGVDGAALRRALADARWWTIPPFLASLFAFYWIKTWRWSCLLQPLARVGHGPLFRVVMVGYAAGALLPMQLGEVVRAWLGARTGGIRVAASLMSIALERVLDLLSILLLVALSAWAMPDLPDVLRGVAVPLAGVATAGMAVLALFALRTDDCLRWVRRVGRFLPDSLALRVEEQLASGMSGLAALRLRRLWVRAIAGSIAQWVFMFACIWLSLHALDVAVGPGAAVLALVLTVVGISLPNPPGYVGSIQLAFTLALAPYGVGASAAVAASLYFHVLAYLSVVVVGLWLLPSTGLRVADLPGLRRRVQSVARDPGTPPAA